MDHDWNDGQGSPTVVLPNRGFRVNSEATHRRNHGYGYGADRGGNGEIHSVDVGRPGWKQT